MNKITADEKLSIKKFFKYQAPKLIQEDDEDIELAFTISDEVFEEYSISYDPSKRSFVIDEFGAEITSSCKYSDSNFQIDLDEYLSKDLYQFFKLKIEAHRNDTINWERYGTTYETINVNLDAYELIQASKFPRLARWLFELDE